MLLEFAVIVSGVKDLHFAALRADCAKIPPFYPNCRSFVVSRLRMTTTRNPTRYAGGKAFDIHSPDSDYVTLPETISSEMYRHAAARK